MNRFNICTPPPISDSLVNRRCDVRETCKLRGTGEVVTNGRAAHARSSESGSLIDVDVSADRNGTSSRDVRGPKWLFLGRKEDLRPLQRTGRFVCIAQRAPRFSAYNFENGATGDTQPAEPGLPPLWRSTRGILASSDPSDVVAQGVLNGGNVDLADGVMAFVGASEMADYPAASDAWNFSQPYAKKMTNATLTGAPSLPDASSDGIWISLNYIFWLLGFVSACGCSGWAVLLWILEFIAVRTQRARAAWNTPLERQTAHTSKKTTHFPTAPSSGQTAGVDSDDEVYVNLKNASREGKVVFDNDPNQLMIKTKCRRGGTARVNVSHRDRCV